MTPIIMLGSGYIAGVATCTVVAAVTVGVRAAIRYRRRRRGARHGA